jgi:hypothetical protein
MTARHDSRQVMVDVFSRTSVPHEQVMRTDAYYGIAASAEIPA